MSIVRLLWISEKLKLIYFFREGFGRLVLRLLLGQLVVRDQRGDPPERRVGVVHALLRLIHVVRRRRPHVRPLRRRIHLPYVHRPRWPPWPRQPHQRVRTARPLQRNFIDDRPTRGRIGVRRDPELRRGVLHGRRISGTNAIKLFIYLQCDNTENLIS